MVLSLIGAINSAVYSLWAYAQVASLTQGGTHTPHTLCYCSAGVRQNNASVTRSCRLVTAHLPASSACPLPSPRQHHPPQPPPAPCLKHTLTFCQCSVGVRQNNASVARSCPHGAGKPGMAFFQEDEDEWGLASVLQVRFR
jgi:hypothetical protein